MSVARIYQQLKNIYHFFQAWAWRVWYGLPDRGMAIYGVTGTNGKTTTCIVLGSILRAAYGKGSPPAGRVGLLSTIVFWIGDEEIVNETKMTTMKSRQMFRYLRDMKRRGVTQVALEITSHALDQHRLAGIELAGAIITNVQREHLDYHETMEEYAKAKGRIVEYIKPGGVLIGKDDDALVKKILDAAESTPIGVRVVRFTSAESQGVQTPLIGDFNKENVLAAMKLARGVGISEAAIRAGVAAVKSVPGRMEWVVAKPQTPMTNAQPRVLIDYAVTPDALEKLYAYARSQTKGKIYAILGAAGLRDRGKRPEMARVVAKYADELILTREDPWTESEEQIFGDLEAGLETHPNPPLSGREFPPDKGDQGGFSWKRIVDRREALQYVLSKAQAGDVVVVTGKGAERGMGVGKEIIPWHERTIIEELLRETPSPRSARALPLRRGGWSNEVRRRGMVLLIDTATHMARVALEKNGEVVEERTWEIDRQLGRVVLEKISETLEAQKIGWGKIDQIAVVEGGTGGSFMAQRTGRITASMLAEANSKEVVVRKSP